jgi:hsp70-interacting protein
MSSSSADPFAWLGLLQWSLRYSDGTAPTSENISPMSPEDKAFLEKVMQEGIINENERMKTILHQVTEQIEIWKTTSPCNTSGDNQNDDDHKTVNEMIDLLQELRDIVEQIDFARAFMSMKGLYFLLGCIENKEDIYIPYNIRILCCAIIATLCQHNPPVQKEFIELGALKVLYNLLQRFTNDVGFDKDMDDTTRTEFLARIVQAMSAIVRSYDLAETIFCQLEQANDVYRLGFQGPVPVQKRTLFFLRALLTSDMTSMQRIHQFQAYIVYVVDTFLLTVNNDTDVDTEIVEMSLSMIQQVLEQRISVNAILARKDALAATAVRRISYIRQHRKKDDGDDSTYQNMDIELESWERILSLLADSQPDKGMPPLNE